MNRAKFERFCNDFYKSIFDFAPKDTWNLAQNGLRMEYTDPKTIKIYVDQKIAPYMVYTNEVWVSPRWKGKKNPNEHWWNKIFIVTANELAKKYEGVFKDGKSFIVNGVIKARKEE